MGKILNYLRSHRKNNFFSKIIFSMLLQYDEVINSKLILPKKHLVQLQSACQDAKFDLVAESDNASIFARFPYA